MKACHLIIFSLILISTSHAVDSDYFKVSSVVFDDKAPSVVEIFIDPAYMDSIITHMESSKTYPADFVFTNRHIPADTVENIGMRLRGTTSRYAYKKSFKLDFNEYEKGQKFHGLEKMNLKAVFTDPSVARARLYSDIARAYHLPCFRANHVQLYINDAYYGLYINVEHVDENFIKAHFGNNDGNLYECSLGANLLYLGADQSLYKGLMNIHNQFVYEVNSISGNDDYSDLIHLIEVINLSPDSLFRFEIEKVLNVPAYYRAMALDVVTANWDNYWYYANNYYLYHNTETDKFEWIPVDGDESFGLWWENHDFATQNIYRWGKNYQRPLAARIKEVTDYRNMYSHFIRDLVNEVCIPDSMNARIDALHKMITPALESDPYYGMETNPEFQYTIHDFHASFESALDSFPHVHYGLKDYFTVRSENALSQLHFDNTAPLIMETRHIPQYPPPGSPITVTTQIYDEDEIIRADLCYRQDGEFTDIPMAKVASGRTGDYTWVVDFIPLNHADIVEYYLVVEDDDGEIRMDPPDAPGNLHKVPIYTEQPSLFINEFMASNDYFITDEDGDFDDWIELYNDADSDVSLPGYYLTDDFSRPRKWALPDVTIGAKGFLLIWADEDGDQGQLHANFKLNAAGEEIGLFKGDSIHTASVDTLTFPEQVTDLSYGRVVDGGAEWDFFDSPSPGCSNTPTNVKSRKSIIPVGKLQLLRNYPNPFNASTLISFQLRERGRVLAEIFDIKGRMVVGLIDGEMNQGTHSIVWHGTGSNGEIVSSGIYFLRIRYCGESYVIKMLGLK
jgi:spore coat protein CotH